MLTRVADASVLAAWFFDEPNRTHAGALLEGFELYAPDLLPYELANVAWVKSRQMSAAADKIAEALADAMEFNIFMMPVKAAQLLTVARQLEVTAYDAAYICVARTIGCPIATFDRRLAKAAVRAGLAISVP
ncbi:MAG TPA: type II toxin-antitoxin system VapC family toxin [Candidatus Binataceae bacterium]|nr:type II toxin-antitoxin system VapC family toxin [Candidatus Binataceae bacterium]